ncbi:3-deoxy-7-phosphoheptulonate synthase [Jidongwangia harbinensis]|uniref:3-deoxy-7-phosphoheptulonate synthase n=1 Tax=Jidongwangia harbinensis TaxID=2878561 RepID=UPI001CDA49B4|nr:3-deoxy-7-phosphoheptulonate synthase [Jidongwangia harbinensis]MCA2218253.1 3-deoxy-7-phosphoheptulonate synthase [Jidongwangia harbinensis]
MTWAGPAASVSGLSRDEIRRWRAMPAAQQPEWGDDWLIEQVVDDLGGMPGLVGWHEVQRLRGVLAEVVAGRRRVVQAGDCAEDPDDCRPGPLRRKVALLDAMAQVVGIMSGKPAIRVGRLAGQFAKPRSTPTERIGDVELPAYRGHLVNGPAPDPAARRPDPLRLLTCYTAARGAMAYLDATADRADPVWTSHEALVLDYEVPLVRRDPDGQLTLTSTHWPWIGERTRRPDGAHVRLLAAVTNPVGCKIGPGVTEDDLRTLCAVLDPRHTPGRLTFIVRMGAELIGSRLPRLVRAVRAAGHPVIWLCDPMHGNTERGPDGVKTRRIGALLRELTCFQEIVDGTSGVAGGLHLETTPDPVVECRSDDGPLGPRTTLCDPRLNTEQALLLTEHWHR